MASECVSDLVLHELHKLVLDARALCLSGHDLTLRSMLAELVVCLLSGRRTSCKIVCQKPVHHHVRITADRRGEMCVIFECKSVMAEVFGIIAGLGHGPERKKLDRIIFRCVLGGSEQVVQLLGYLLSIGCRSHPVAEVADEVTEALDLLLVRLVMDTIHEGLRLLAGSLLRSLPYSLAAGRDKLRYGPVGKEHELLDEPVSLLCHLLVYIDRTSRLVYLDLHFRTVEADRSCREPLLAELCRKAVQYEDSILDLFRNAFMRGLRSGLDYRLSLFVCKSEV